MPTPTSMRVMTSTGLRPDAVAEMAEDHAAERPRKETDAESRERQQQAGVGSNLGKNKSLNTSAAAVP